MCVGIPAKVVAIEASGPHTATVDVEGVGDWVLLHVGFAMAKIDEAEAVETLAFMRELGSVYDDEVEAFGTEPP